MGQIVHRLRITINGHVYEATVEDLDEAPGAPAPPPPGAGRSAARRAAAPSAAAAAPGEVRAPLPGIVAEIKVQVGQQVEAGDVLLVLEAMKMDNEIHAPRAGRVSALKVARGEQVASGQVLAVVG